MLNRIFQNKMEPNKTKLKLVELVNPDNNERQAHLLNPSVFSEPVEHPVIQYIYYYPESPRKSILKAKVNTEVKKLPSRKLIPDQLGWFYEDKGHAELQQKLEQNQESLENCRFLKYYNPINLKEGPTAGMFESLEAITIVGGIIVNPWMFVFSGIIPLATELMRRSDKKEANKNIEKLTCYLQKYDNFCENVKRAEIDFKIVPEANQEVDTTLRGLDTSPHLDLNYESLNNKLKEIYEGIE